MRYLQRLGFLSQLWRVNLLSAMEYRVSFITQIAGMILQNGLYFVFWILFFDRFEALHGWTLQDMILLFAIVGTGLGLTMMLFGNCTQIATIVAAGDLDRYLSLPRPILLHVLASRTSVPSVGDFTFGSDLVRDRWGLLLGAHRALPTRHYFSGLYLYGRTGPHQQSGFLAGAIRDSRRAFPERHGHFFALSWHSV